MTPFFFLDAGLVIAQATHTGRSNFIVHLLSSSGAIEGFLTNEIGPYNGSSAEGVRQSGSYLLDIRADGDWTITLTQPRPGSAYGAPQTFSGRGRSVSPFIQLGSGIITFRMTHNGRSNFIVHLVDLDGDTVGFLANEIGPFTGSRAIGLQNSGVYLLDIDADGDWSIVVEQTTGTPGPPPPRPEPACSPRPRVVVSVAPSGSDHLNVTITASGANNYVRELRFGHARNAVISAAGQVAGGNFTVGYSGFPPSVSFTVQRSTLGQPVHAPLVVADGCGDWPTFVGAGTGAR